MKSLTTAHANHTTRPAWSIRTDAAVAKV